MGVDHATAFTSQEVDLIRRVASRRSRHDLSGRCLPWIVAAVIGPVGCSRQPSAPIEQATASSTPTAIPAADRPPAALVQIGASARALFDAAYASDWDAAMEDVQSLNEFGTALPTTLPSPDLTAQLHSRLEDLRQTVRMRDRVQTLDVANGLTKLAADLSAEFQVQVPYEVVMLAYYGRQLEFGLAANRLGVLRQAATDLRSMWNRTESAVEKRSVEDARRFTDIVVTLDGARRPVDYVAPTRAALAEADHIERLFRSP